MSKSKYGRPPERLVPCMPPLLDEETKPLSREDGLTKFGGTACENLVKAYFLSQNINIAEPHVDDGVDLLIEKPDGWVRGQVKKVVYQLGLDDGIFKRSGRKVYRSRFNFNFQGGGRRVTLSSGYTKQRGPESFDYFYHVLMTQYRQLIWETPVSLIPLRENGEFVHGKNPCLDRDSWKRKPADIEWSKYLVYRKFDPIIFETYPDFFVKPEQPTLHSLFDEVQ